MAECSGGLDTDLEWRVMAAVKAAEDRGDPPLLRAVEAARCVQERGLGLPNPELAHVLVSKLCFSNNTPSLWKLLDQAMASRLVSPIHALALLTPRQGRDPRDPPSSFSDLNIPKSYLSHFIEEFSPFFLMAVNFRFYLMNSG